jgi:hypothetical protein
MSDKAELDRLWSALDKTNQYIEGLEQRMVFRVAPIGDVKFTHDCHGRKLESPFMGQHVRLEPGTHIRYGASFPTQLAPVPDYSLASEDAGDFHEPTLPGVERCSCEETETLRALLRSAREHVPSAQSDWHERVAEVLRG